MESFFKGFSTVDWVAVALFVNQLLSMLRTWVSKKTMTKDVKTIKDQVMPNGGNSMNDKVDKISKRVEEQIALSEAFFTIMMNRDDEALFRADQKGEWIFCNNKTSDIFGMYHRDMLGKGWEIAIGQTINERYEFVKAWNELINDNSPLNHQVWIRNQENHSMIDQYLITASKVTANGIFQFYLGKIQKVN